MITIEEIRDWLKSFEFGANMYSIGQFDMKQEKVIACFETLDGDDNSQPYDLHFTKTIDLYIHWNNDYNEVDEKAMEIYKTLFRRHSFKINNKQVSFLIVSSIRDEYKDEAGIYNRSIKIQFIQ